MSRWSRSRVAVAGSVLVLAIGLSACDRSSDSDQEIADLEAELEQTQSALDASESANDELAQEAADLQTSLTETEDQLASTQEELGTTQAELLDAQAQLASVGEVVLANGTYVGQVLGAKASPYRVIVFNAAGLFRVAQVADDVTITASGSDFTLQQFGRLLSSTNPDDAKLANGNYQVIVKDNLVTSIRKSKA